MSDPEVPLLRTPLYVEHKRLGARMVPFAGWEMPVQYSGVIEEHTAVRTASGMFDVSHMGRFELHGPGALTFLRHITTWDITRLAQGEGHYAASCREDGGILDDVYVFSVEPERALIVVNASNASKMKAWMETHIVKFDAMLVDRHESTAMIAVQGPNALPTLKGILGNEFVSSLKPRRCGETQWLGQTLFASRTGYTGEDGLELITEARAGPELWRALLDAGVTPVGLGARDTLRLEAALLLYGNDMDESTNPWECGLGWTVTLDDRADFIGKQALLDLRERGAARELACLAALERGIMRGGCAVLRDGTEVGNVTSGGYSPTLAKSIGMAYLPPGLSDEGTELTVDVRGKPLRARVVPRPFYRRPQAKSP